MGWIGWTLTVVAIGALGFAAYVRLAPSDPARWHVMPEGIERGDYPGGAVRQIAAGPETLARLDRIVRGSPRTEVLAGSVDEGMITYVTRSRLFGFPDYTTVQQRGETLLLHGRLRFGQSDLGVNAARIDGWLAALGQGG